MKLQKLLYFLVPVLVLTAALPFLSSKSLGVYAQGNRISGYVFGQNRQPMEDLNVELMDDYHRTIGRTLTTSTGYYQFGGLGAKTFTIKVYTLGTDYEEQENSVDLTSPTGAITYETSDFYFKAATRDKPGECRRFCSRRSA